MTDTLRQQIKERSEALSLEFKKVEPKPATASTNENTKLETTGFGGFLGWFFGPSKPNKPAPSELRFYSPKMTLFGAKRYEFP